MNSRVKDINDEYNENDFNETMKLLSKKKSEKYPFLLKGGNSLRSAVFNMFKAVWELERKPKQWENTNIVQLYKGKGECEDLNNHRNIHIVDHLPKAFETILVEKVKPIFIENCSKFQIGAIPGHRPQDHLFVLKSTIALYMYLDLPLILHCFDVSKFFDKESLLDAQGKVGSGLISAVNLGNGINTFFEGSPDEICYGDLRLQPLLYQDDLGRLCSTVQSAQAGLNRVATVMNIKQLKMNVDKSFYILFGKKKTIEDIRTLIKNNPLTLSGANVKEKTSEKYLGDHIHSDGPSRSAEVTVEKRYWPTVSALLEIRTILEDYRANVVGGANTGIMIFEMAVIPMLMNSAETWDQVCLLYTSPSPRD